MWKSPQFNQQDGHNSKGGPDMFTKALNEVCIASKEKSTFDNKILNIIENSGEKEIEDLDESSIENRIINDQLQI